MRLSGNRAARGRSRRSADAIATSMLTTVSLKADHHLIEQACGVERACASNDDESSARLSSPPSPGDLERRPLDSQDSVLVGFMGDSGADRHRHVRDCDRVTGRAAARRGDDRAPAVTQDASVIDRPPACETPAVVNAGTRVTARRWGWAPFLIGLALASPASAWGMGGGGGGFGGGGFRGGGGSAPYGAGSDGLPEGDALWLVVAVTVVGVLMLFVGPTLVGRYRRRRVLRRDAAVERETRAAAHEGYWGPARLKDRVRECFFPVRESWKRLDVSASRPYVSDALYERHRLQLEEMKRQRRANRIENLVLSDVRLVRLRKATNGTADRFVARIESSARDWVADLRRRVVVEGDPDTDRSLVEYWSFARHPDHGWVLDEIQQRNWRHRLRVELVNRRKQLQSSR